MIERLPQPQDARMSQTKARFHWNDPLLLDHQLSPEERREAGVPRGVDEDVDWGGYLLDYLEDLEIGWAAWSYSDHPHLVTADARTTPFGELVRQRLADPTMESWNRS